MLDTDPILELRNVTVESLGVYDSGIWNVSLALQPGQLGLVWLERGHWKLPLADAACGLLEPAAGQVRFLGQDWRGLPPHAGAQRRGLIGRVLDHAWLTSLPIDTNIMLAQLHHTLRPLEQIETEAERLSVTFGLPGLPRGEHLAVRPQDLHRAACVRAFLGSPRLLLLDDPTRGMYAELLPAMINCVLDAQQRGAAILWLTRDQHTWDEISPLAAFRRQMSGAQLLDDALEVA